MNNQNLLISVLIPIYNVEKFLPACIDSAINQTYKNIEIILIDDGSPDKCPQICDEYAKKDSRIKVIHKENGGISSARNAGIELAQGEFLYFLDSDDFIDECSLEILMRPFIENFDVDISIGGFEKVSELAKFYNEEISNLDNIQYVEIKDYEALFHIKLWVTVWGKLIKKQLYKDLRFPVGKLHEDEFVTYKLYDKCRKIYYCEKELYKYRQNENSIMHHISKQRIENGIEGISGGLFYFYSKNNKYCQYLYGRRLANYLNKINKLSRENKDIEFRIYEKKFFKDCFKYLHIKTQIKYLIKRILIMLKLI